MSDSAMIALHEMVHKLWKRVAELEKRLPPPPPAYDDMIGRLRAWQRALKVMP